MVAIVVAHAHFRIIMVITHALSRVAMVTTYCHYSRQLDPDCQCLLFSATYEEDVMRFAQTVIPDPILIRLKREEQSLDTIKQFYVSEGRELDRERERELDRETE